MGQGLKEVTTHSISDGVGLLIVHTGGGKGKTTAALGLLLRAWGHGMKVVMLQFMKRPSAEYGEHKAAERLGIEMLAHGSGFTRRSKDAELGVAMARELWEMAKVKICSGEHDMVILDEFSYPLNYGWITTKEAIDVLCRRPKEMHVVLTGRAVPREIVEIADLVTEMCEVKHPFRSGVKAQQGIEF
ncbi:MAG: cob(I)yrinic acid a,c-diamide adenosyltransferase [Chloroflexota bacterium]